MFLRSRCFWVGDGPNPRIQAGCSIERSKPMLKSAILLEIPSYAGGELLHSVLQKQAASFVGNSTNLLTKRATELSELSQLTFNVFRLKFGSDQFSDFSIYSPIFEARAPIKEGTGPKQKCKNDACGDDI